MHYPLEVMLTCVRWYAAYPLGDPIATGTGKDIQKVQAPGWWKLADG